MSLKQRITDDMKTAMKAGEKDRLGVIRLIQAAIKQREVDERIVLDDAQIIAALEKMLKQRRDSIAQYSQAGREDLADRERFEVSVIETYLPAQMTADEIEAAVKIVIAETGAKSAQDMGKVMAALKPKLAGRADMGAASATVKRLLNE